MTKRFLTAPALLFATSFLTPNMGHAQTFKVEKFDIKADGGTDYVAVESATGRVFVSRANHMMVVEGATGKVLVHLFKQSSEALGLQMDTFCVGTRVFPGTKVWT